MITNYHFDYITDCDHLKCFVEVGQTIAKNSTEQHLLSTLQDVGIGFASLFYDLPENTGFDDFHIKCKSVLNALRQRSYLNNNMVRSYLIWKIFKGETVIEFVQLPYFTG